VLLVDIVEELIDEDGDVLDDEVLDGAVLEEVLDGYCKLLDDGFEDDDGLDDVLWADELVWANAPPHRPAAQSSVMILVVR